MAQRLGMVPVSAWRGHRVMGAREMWLAIQALLPEFNPMLFKNWVWQHWGGVFKWPPGARRPAKLADLANTRPKRNPVSKQ